MASLDSADGTAAAPGAEPILRTEGLTKKFGELAAVDGVDLTVDRGAVTALIGPNGAGKSTLFNLVCGLFPPTDGRIRFEGADITGRRPHEVTRLGIGRSFQIVDVFEGLTVRENLRLAAQAHHERRDAKWRHAFSLDEPLERAETILGDIGLSELATARADALSHGDRRRLDVALTLATEPSLVLLDEPTAGLGREASAELVVLIEDLVATRDITLVLVEHDLDVVFGIADVINVMHDGELIARGTAEEIQNDANVRRAYLGTTGDS